MPKAKPYLSPRRLAKRLPARNSNASWSSQKDCEITGLCETPDGKAIFVNIQHPGENTPLANIGAPEQYTSHWPAQCGLRRWQTPTLGDHRHHQR